MDSFAHLWRWFVDSAIWDKAAVAVLSSIAVAIFWYFWRAIWRRLWRSPKIDAAVPMPRQEWVGRDGDLIKVHQALFSDKADRKPELQAARVALLHAHGGFGKSTLAALYARGYAKHFAEVWWVSCESERERVRKWETIKRETEESVRPILYVFDNVSDQTQESIRYLIETLQPDARVLITSRSSGWLGGVRTIELKGLDVETAAALLRKRVRDGLDEPRKASHVEDVDGSERLARALGGQPLSLVQAGTRCRRVSFDQYRENIAHYLKEANADAGYGKTEYAVVSESLDDLAKRPDGKAATALAELLAYCASDCIPRTLYTEAFKGPVHVDKAVDLLSDAALIGRANDFDDGDRAVSMHRVVQEVIRDRVKANAPERGAEALSNLLHFLYDKLLSAKASKKDLSFRKYLPHLLQALAHLDEPALRGSDKGDLLDTAVKQVVLKLAGLMETASDEAAKEYIPELPKLIGRFYEVNPLKRLLDAVLNRMDVKSTAWRAFRDDCLAADNYVLRFSLAEALAGQAGTDSGGDAMEEIHKLVSEPKTLNHFELGGYALKCVYSDRSDDDRGINSGLLSLVAGHPCYPGRSILGDLMLNLVYQGQSPEQLLPPHVGRNHRFWEPIWDFVAYDVDAIRAAEHASNGAPLPTRAEQEHKYRMLLEAWRDRLKSQLGNTPRVQRVVADFFTIGADTDYITHNDTLREFRKLGSTATTNQGPFYFVEVLSLLFAHPLWSVAEAAASVVAKLVGIADKERRDKEKQNYLDVIRSLFEPSLPWRVRYGAMEAAYQIRIGDMLDGKPNPMATFSKGVKLFYNDPISKLRGLCAENLFSVMLNASDSHRSNMEKEFDTPIRHWLKDEDCWVLEHIHRYFHALARRGVTDHHFSDAEVSRLFTGLSDWRETEREKFLEHIEVRKEELAAYRGAAA